MWDSRRLSYRVDYLRRDWRMTNGRKATKFYETEAAMERFVDKLLSDDRPDLAPIVMLSVSARPVGDWLTIDERRDFGEGLEAWVGGCGR